MYNSTMITKKHNSHINSLFHMFSLVINYFFIQIRQVSIRHLGMGVKKSLGPPAFGLQYLGCVTFCYILRRTVRSFSRGTYFSGFYTDIAHNRVLSGLT